MNNVKAHWINGAEAPGESGRTIPVLNPATGETVAETPAGTADDVDLAVTAARAAFPAWAATPPAERAAVVRRIADGLKVRGERIAAAISAHPGIDMISFTGSTRAGKRIGAVAADTVKRVALELGGKGATVILDDADFEAAVTKGVLMTFTNGGQVCGAWPRMLVPAARQEEAIALAVKAAAAYSVGDPLDEATVIGPMSSEAHRRKVDGYIRRGLADGARLVFGGPGRPDGLEHGAYVRPTIFADVRPDSAIAQEEIFGPVLTIIPYVDEDEAVAIANGTMYGLTSGVFGEPEHALRVASRLRAGQVDIDDGQWNPLAPFGGYRQSGNGREFGRQGLEEFLETKAIQR